MQTTSSLPATILGAAKAGTIAKNKARSPQGTVHTTLLNRLTQSGAAVFFMPIGLLTSGELARHSLFIRNFALRKTI